MYVLEYCRSQVVGGVARVWGGIIKQISTECKCLLNELSDCLLTNCCVHVFHDLMVLGKKECL